MKFNCLYEFTPSGMDVFQRAFNGLIDESDVDATDQSLVQRVSGTSAFTVTPFATSQEMAAAIISAAGTASVSELLQRPGLWAWLAFVLRDVVYPLRKDGTRKLGEVHRWYPSDLNDYQKGQRHLIRMPVLLLHSFGDDARHLLLGEPSTPGEVREQLTSQQDMFHPAFQAAARLLYLDPKTGKLRRGAAGKKGGSARRLARVRQQLDVTWDLFALTSSEIVQKLPAEFDPFRPAESTAVARTSATEVSEEAGRTA